MPVEAKVSSPGLLLASATSSCAVLTGSSLLTSSTAPVVPKIAIGVRSLTGWYFRVG